MEIHTLGNELDQRPRVGRRRHGRQQFRLRSRKPNDVRSDGEPGFLIAIPYYRRNDAQQRRHFTTVPQAFISLAGSWTCLAIRAGKLEAALGYAPNPNFWLQQSSATCRLSDFELRLDAVV